MSIRLQLTLALGILVVLQFAGCGDSGSAPSGSNSKSDSEKSGQTNAIPDSKASDSKTTDSDTKKSADNSDEKNDENVKKDAVAANDKVDSDTDAKDDHSTTDTSKTDKVSVRVVDLKQYDEVIKSHRGKVVVVDFWATWCLPCRKAFPHTVELHKHYQKQGLAVVSVSIDDLDEPETQGEILAFLDEQGAQFDNLISKYGSNDETIEGFKIPDAAVPHFKIYDRQGKLRHTFETDPEADKQFTHEDIEAKVKELLSEK